MSIDEQCMGEEPLLSPKTVTGWATQHKVLEYDIYTEIITIALPAQSVDELRVRLIRVEGASADGSGSGKYYNNSRGISSRTQPGPNGTSPVGFCSCLICILLGRNGSRSGGSVAGTGNKRKRGDCNGFPANSWPTLHGGGGSWRERGQVWRREYNHAVVQVR